MLTNEQVQMLAELDRDMDAGKVAFVRLNGNRLAMTPETMSYFKLAVGQSISAAAFEAIQRYNLEQAQAEITARKRPN